MPSFEVQVAEAAWQSEPDDPESMTRRVVGALIDVLGPESLAKPLTVRFASNGEIQALNAQYRDTDKPTNVLSFPASPNPIEPYLGDVILAHETVAAEAAAQGKSITNHTCHLIAHGILHLLGYDHQSDTDAASMEALERDVLAGLGIDDPYKDERPAEAAHGA